MFPPLAGFKRWEGRSNREEEEKREGVRKERKGMGVGEKAKRKRRGEKGGMAPARTSAIPWLPTLAPWSRHW